MYIMYIIYYIPTTPPPPKKTQDHTKIITDQIKKLMISLMKRALKSFKCDWMNVSHGMGVGGSDERSFR